MTVVSIIGEKARGRKGEEREEVGEKKMKKSGGKGGGKKKIELSVLND